MKVFNIKGDLIDHIGGSIALDCKTIREVFEALFVTFPGFKKYYLNQLVNGTEYVFIDSSGDVFESFCYDLLLKDDKYTITPMFKGAGLGAIGGFAMNALMGYGMQKLADKMNPIEETGEEYEIIQTNSFLYESNENAVAQGTTIPIVYGQLRVGSLVVNSNIQNYDYNYTEASIYNASQVLSLPGDLDTQDLMAGGIGFGEENNLRGGYVEPGTENIIGTYKDSNLDTTKRPIVTFDSDGTKVYNAAHNNESYTAGYQEDREAGGYSKNLGPAVAGSEHRASTTDDSSAGHGGEGSVKPYLFPPPGDRDYHFRPSSQSDYCYQISQIGGSVEQLSNLRVGPRGEYQKLESIGVYRTLDVLSEGPIAGLALPLIDPPTYDEETLAFGDDNGIVTIALNRDVDFFASANRAARVGNIKFSLNVAGLDGGHLVGETTETSALSIIQGGEGYPANQTQRRVEANDPSEADGGIYIKLTKPLVAEDARFADISFGSESRYGFDRDNLGSGLVSVNKMFALYEYLGSDRDDEDYVGALVFNPFDNAHLNVDASLRLPDDWVNINSPQNSIDIATSPNGVFFDNTQKLELGIASQTSSSINMGDGFADFANNSLDNYIAFSPENEPVNLSARIDWLDSYDRQSQAQAFDFAFLCGAGDPRNRISANDDLLMADGAGVLLGNAPAFVDEGDGWANMARLYYDTRGNGIAASALNTTRTFHLGIRRNCTESSWGFNSCSTTGYSTYTLTISLRSYLELPAVTITRSDWTTNGNCRGCSGTERSNPSTLSADSTGFSFPNRTTDWNRYNIFRSHPTNPDESVNDFSQLIAGNATFLGYLLRNEAFSIAVWDAFNGAHNISQAIYSTYTDNEGNAHRPRYFRLTPGSGSNLNNGIAGLINNGTVPTYTFNQGNSGQFNSVTIPVPGYIPSKSTSLPGDLSENPKGFYIPDLWYRIEVMVLRKSRSSGTSARYSYQFKNTSIDAFAQISEHGVVRNVHLAGVSDEPVWDNLLERWTPFSITHPDRPMISNTRSELGNVETYYQDLAIVLKIDASHDFQNCSLRCVNGVIQPPTGNVNVDMDKLKVFDNWSSYISQLVSSEVSPQPAMAAKGVCPDNVNIAGSGKTFVLDDLYKSNGYLIQEELAPGGTPARVTLSCERINLSNTRYNMANAFIDAKETTETATAQVKRTFYTGRVTGLTVNSGGSGYTATDGSLLNGPFLQFNIFNKMKCVKELIVHGTIRSANRGYKKNDTFFIHGSLSTNNFGNNTTAGTYLWRRYQFKAMLKTNDLGRITNKIVILDPGYSNNENLSQIVLPISNTNYLWMKNRFRMPRFGETPAFFQNSTLGMSLPNPNTLFDSGSIPIEPKDNEDDPDVEYNAAINFNEDDYDAIGNLGATRYMAQDQSQLLNPGVHLNKKQLILFIPPSAVTQSGFEGKISFVTLLHAGLGFNSDFSEFKDLESGTDNISFLVNTDAEGAITSINIDQSRTTAGYTESDGSINVRIAPPAANSTSTVVTPPSQDSYGWARSIYLNNTPIREKDKRFNFSNFHFNFLGGYYKNGYDQTQDISVDVDDLNPDYDYRLMSDEFQFPSQTYPINYILHAPRNNGEKDYCYSHTVKNPAVSNVSLTFKINELHYIYEGDENLVFINLKPIVGAIIGWLLAKKLIEKGIEMVVGDLSVDSTNTAGAVGPCGGPVATTGAGIGYTPNVLSGGASMGVTEGLIEIASAAAGLLGGLLGFALGSKFPCSGSGGFLCIKIGSVIKNSGEIWPATIRIAVEHGLEGETLTEEDITIQGCATSPMMKDIFLSRFPLTSKITGTNIYKNRIIKVYRKTREFDPVSGGIMEARYKIDAELFSVNEFVGGYFSYPNTAVMGVRCNSKDMPSIPQREYLIKGKLVKLPNGYSSENGTYGGSDTRAESFFQQESDGRDKLSWTSNPAWIIYDLLINPVYGMGKYGLTDDDIDKWSFFKFAQRADEAVDVIVDSVSTKERRYMCNVYINQQKPAYEYIKELLSLYNTTLHFSGGKIYISIDEPGDSVMLFNNSNVSEASFAYSTTPKSNRISACTVDYLDERDNYMLKSEYFEDPALIEEFGYSHIKIAGISITRRGEANRLALSKVYSKQLETEIIQFTTSLQGSYLRIGDVIDVIDNNKVSSYSGGRITKINSSNRAIIELDIPVSGLPDNITSILIQDIIDSVEDTEDEEGEHTSQYTEYTMSKNSGFQITLNSALPTNVEVGFSWVIKSGSDTHGNIKTKQYRVKSIKEIDDLQYEIQALEYIAEKYNIIDGTVNDDIELDYDGHDITIPSQSNFPEDID